MIQQFHFWVFSQRKWKLTWKCICTPMFIAALFITVEIWKQPNCPSMDVVYSYNKILYSSIKKKEILPFLTTWMDFEGIMLSEICKTVKDKYLMILLICGIENKHKTKLTDTGTGGCQRSGGGGAGEWGHKAQTSSYKISKSWGCNVQHGDCS